MLYICQLRCHKNSSSIIAHCNFDEAIHIFIEYGLATEKYVTIICNKFYGLCLMMIYFNYFLRFERPFISITFVTFWIVFSFFLNKNRSFGDFSQISQFLNLNKLFVQSIYGIKKFMNQFIEKSSNNTKINQNEPSQKLINDILYWAHFRLLFFQK